MKKRKCRPPTKKELKRFIKLYRLLVDFMCEEYNVQAGRDGWVGDDGWYVEELKPELAAINHLFIDVPEGDKTDLFKYGVTKLGKESKGALMQLIRIKNKDLCKKR